MPIILYWAWQGPILHSAYKDYRAAKYLMTAPKTDKYLKAALAGHGYSQNGVEQDTEKAMRAQAHLTSVGTRMAGGFFLLAALAYVLSFVIDLRRYKIAPAEGRKRE